MMMDAGGSPRYVAVPKPEMYTFHETPMFKFFEPDDEALWLSNGLSDVTKAFERTSLARRLPGAGSDVGRAPSSFKCAKAAVWTSETTTDATSPSESYRASSVSSDGDAAIDLLNSSVRDLQAALKVLSDAGPSRDAGMKAPPGLLLPPQELAESAQSRPLTPSTTYSSPPMDAPEAAQPGLPDEYWRHPRMNSSLASSFKAQFKKTQWCMYLKQGCLRGDQCNFAHSIEELQSAPNLVKTSICKAWERGTCKNGTGCRFAHGENELRMTPGFFKRTLCKYYARGQCNLGSRCRHAHSLQELALPTAEVSNGASDEQTVQPAVAGRAAKFGVLMQKGR